MGGSWSKLKPVEVADLYAEAIIDTMQDYGVTATDPETLVWNLRARAHLESLNYLTPEVVKADRILMESGVHPKYFDDLAQYGSEWPLHMPEIQGGKFPIEKIPQHLRELALTLYYNKAKAA